MTGPFDVLHLKKRTAGSSNELSFDVLESASRGLDDKKERQPLVGASAPGPKQGSYHGVGGTSTLSAVPEVERRKRARRARSARMWIIVVVAVVALVGTGVYFGYRFHQDRVDFSSNFNHLIDRFVEIDRTMVEVDSLMVDPLNSAATVERSEVADRFASLNRELNAVTAAARDLEPRAQSDRDRAALSEIEAAANARSDMLAAAEGAFTFSKHANQLAETAAKSWSRVLEADSLAREATTLANSAKTEQATRDAQEKTQQARDLMATALTELSIVEKEQKGIDLSAEKAYINKRIEALDAAIATSKALLAADRNAARQANDAYNVADRAAAELAENLPPSVTEQVKSAFQKDLDEELKSYTEARNAVTSSDSVLRAYL